MWGLQEGQTSNLICQAGESSSFLFPTPASTYAPFPVGKGKLVSPIFLHRDIKVNYDLSLRLSSTVASPWLICVTKGRPLLQYISCDLCKNAENLSYSQCIFMNRLFHNDCKASTCIVSMRLLSLHLEKFIKKSVSVGKGTTGIVIRERQGHPLFCKQACLHSTQHHSRRDLLVLKLHPASWRISWRCSMQTIFLRVFLWSASFRKEAGLTFTVCNTLALGLALFTCEWFLRGLFMCLE